MNTRLYLFSIVAVLILTVGPHAIGKIDPATVAGLWLFEEGGGNIATDSSDAGNHGTIAGPKKWQQGKFGRALEFNGSDVYVEVEAMTASFLKN